MIYEHPVPMEIIMAALYGDKDFVVVNMPKDAKIIYFHHNGGVGIEYEGPRQDIRWEWLYEETTC